MSRAVIVALSGLVVIAAGTAALLIAGNDDALPPAPLPSDEQLRTSGFAVWPEDTMTEGLEACETPKSWQLDPQETAFEFAREVLKYPDPELNTGPIGDSGAQVRYLMGSRGVRGVGVFLGSVIDVKRYDRCWFVVKAEDREEADFDKISYRQQSGDIWLVVHHRGLIETEIGFGAWERRFEPLASRGNPPAPPQHGAKTSVRLPTLDPDATGHIMSLTRNEQGIVVGVAARPLGFVPAE